MRIFKEEALEVHVLLVNIKSAIEEFVNGRIQGVNYKFLAKWDFDMEKSWSFKQIGDHRLNDRKALGKNASWQAPLVGWKKLNFDGAGRGNLGQSGVGAIIRNEDGEVVHAISGLVGIATNNVAEIVVLEVGLRWCVNNEIDKLIIEGDSQIILNGVSKFGFQNWRLASWILRINSLLTFLGEYHIQHTFQEGNKSADQLAKMGIEEGTTKEFGRDETMPIVLKKIISRDRGSIMRIGDE
ncbi:hypothetical protein SUGI_0935720 [Cryptomeria japonica]|nr:hypothetical protein SUGI_0935720 [Cryptomeria japonica]